MVKVGDTVTFDPFDEIKIPNMEDGQKIVETGVVTEIHEDHNWFRVEYGDPGYRQHTCFHFADVGQKVFVV